MQLLTKAALETTQELWAMVGEEEEREDIALDYIESLWRMVANVCAGYALQHTGAGDCEAAEAFTILEEQALARQPMLKLLARDPVKLAVVSSLHGLH